MHQKIRQPLRPDDPMYKQAVDAMKKYDQAKIDGDVAADRKMTQFRPLC